MRKLRQHVLALAMAAVGGITYTPAVVAATTESFDVTITITATCNIGVTTPATDVAFGSHPSTDTNATATGIINVTCTQGTDYQVELDNGLYYSATRRMNDGGTNYVAYGLYQDASHLQPWTTVLASEAYSGTGSGSEQPLTVYGLVPSANSPAGAYTDTVTATVTF